MLRKKNSPRTTVHLLSVHLRGAPTVCTAVSQGGINFSLFQLDWERGILPSLIMMGILLVINVIIGLC